jgi:hypothetical protein
VFFGEGIISLCCRKHSVHFRASVAIEAPAPSGPDGPPAAKNGPKGKGRQPRNKAWRKDKEATGDVVQAASALLQPDIGGESAQSDLKLLDWLNEDGVDKAADVSSSVDLKRWSCVLSQAFCNHNSDSRDTHIKAKLATFSAVLVQVLLLQLCRCTRGS